MAAKIIRHVFSDIICLAVVWLPVLLLNLLGKPFQRGFYCNDASIQYPFKDSTISNAVLYSYSLGLPIASILTVEVFRLRNKFHSNRQTRASSHNIPSLRIPVAMVIHVVVIFLFGAACSQLTTDFCKYTVGRLRPHFIDVCKPVNLDGSELCPLELPPICITQYKCTGTDERLVREARLSYPSGHSSLSAYAMLFLAFYLQLRMNWPRSKLLRLAIQIVVIMMAWYTGLSRITDFKHHWSDVSSGFLIGALAASLTAQYMTRIFKRRRRYE